MLMRLPNFVIQGLYYLTLAAVEIDSKVLSFYTKLSNCFQKSTGRNNFFLAKISYHLVTFTTLVDGGTYFIKGMHPHGGTLSIICFLIFATMGVEVSRKCDTAENSSGSEKVDHRFPWSGIFWRMFGIFSILLLGPSGIVGIIGSNHPILWTIVQLYSAFFASYCYLIAVEPLPPCKGKIKEFLESLSRRLVPIMAKN